MKNKVLKGSVIALSLIAVVGLLPANANNSKMDLKNTNNVVSVQNKINSNIELTKSNLNLFLNENSALTGAFVNLDSNTRAQINTTTNSYLNNLTNLRIEFETNLAASGSTYSSDLKKVYSDKLKEISNSYYNEIKALVSSDNTALAWVEARKNLTLKDFQNMPYNWKDWKDDRKDMIKSYKDKFSKPINDRFEKIHSLSPETVDLLVGRIDNLIANYQQNSNLSAEATAKVVAQLNAIKEIMLELRANLFAQ